MINIYYEEHEGNNSDSPKNILMVPTISDVSTVEEWRSVARDIVQRDGDINWRTTIVDWPGFGYSDRPKMDYTADVMEKFLVDFINSPDSPVNGSGWLVSIHSCIYKAFMYTSLLQPVQSQNDDDINNNDKEELLLIVILINGRDSKMINSLMLTWLECDSTASFVSILDVLLVLTQD